MDRQLIEFGAFVLDLSARILERDGEVVHVPPRPMALLILLATHAGEALERDRILDEVWSDVIVAEANLTQTVWLLRKVLDDAEGRLVQTVPRVGYRFTREVRQVEASGSGSRAEVETGPQPMDRPRPEWRVWPYLVLLAMVVVGVAVWLWPDRRVADPVTPESVSVLTLRNLADDESTAWLGTAVAEMMTAELARSGEIAVVPGSRLTDLGRQISPEALWTPAAAAVGLLEQRFGPGFVLVGSYLVLPDDGVQRLRVDLRVHRVPGGDLVGSVTRTGTVAELFEIVAALGAATRDLVDLDAGIEIDPGGGLPLDAEAARAYADGLRALRDFKARRATELLERAARLEPDATMVHVALSEAWSDLGYDRRAREWARRAAGRVAELPASVALAVRARLAELETEWELAAGIYRELWARQPSASEWGLELAECQRKSGQLEEARATVARLRGLPFPHSEDPRIDLAAADIAHVSGELELQLDLAERAAARCESLGLELLAAAAVRRQAVALRRLGQLDASLEMLARAEVIFERHEELGRVVSVLNSRANTLRALGRNDEARAAFERGLEISEAIGFRLGSAHLRGNLALVEKELGDRASSLHHHLQAVEDLRALGDTVGEATNLINAAGVQAALGDIDDARVSYSRGLELSREMGERFLAAWAEVGLCQLEWRVGDVATARRWCRRGAEALRQQSRPLHLAIALYMSAVIALDDADLERARGLLGEIRDLDRQQVEPEITARADQLEGYLLATENRWHAALESLERSAERWHGSGQHYLADFPRLAALRVRADHLPTAELLEESRELAQRFAASDAAGAASEARAVTALAAAESGDDDSARRIVDALQLETKRRADRRFAMTTGLLLARVWLELGEPDEARRQLEAVRAEARAVGHTLYELSAEVELVRLDAAVGVEGAADELARLRQRAGALGLDRLAARAEKVVSPPI